MVGIESNPLMLRRARPFKGVEYRLGTAPRTGLPSGSVDIVTCSQSFHWMPQRETRREVARVLRRGGVFAVYDYELPPLVDPRLDSAFDDLLRWSGLTADRQEKAAQAASLSRSGRFRWVREGCLGHSDLGSARRMLDLALSIAHVSARLEAGEESPEPHWRRFRDATRQVLGKRRRRFWWTYDTILAVK